jgi:protein SCO1/2
MIRRIFILLGIAVLGAVILMPPNALAAELRLVDHNSQPIIEAEFGPAYRIVYFGYTHCPDACPLALQTLSDAIDRLGRIGESITPVFITVDPARDTPETLKKYVDMFHPRLKAVSGDDAAIAEIAGRYKVIYTKAELGEGRPYTMDHTTSIYLTDKTGRIIGKFLHTLSAGELAAKIAARLAREP